MMQQSLLGSLQEVPLGLLPPSMQVMAPVEHEVIPFLQEFGLVVHEAPAVHETHVPVLLQTMLVPQLVPPALLPPSTQVLAPVEQEYTPFLQMFGLPVQAPPAVHATHVPELQTMLVPQLVPAALLPPSTQVWLPVAQEYVPFLQMFGLVVQEPPAVQATHVPELLQTMLVPQLVPGASLLPSTQVMAPVEQEVIPFLQAFGLLVHACPAAHAVQVPEPLQTMLVPQLTPGDLLLPSTQVMAPVEQEVIPFLQAFGLVVHDCPVVHEVQVPEPLQTMLVPQLVPAAFAVPLTQVAVPVVHDATPL
jgi:hypothetical protein